jgi:hypothetical protein
VRQNRRVKLLVDGPLPHLLLVNIWVGLLVSLELRDHNRFPDSKQQRTEPKMLSRIGNRSIFEVVDVRNEVPAFVCTRLACLSGRYPRLPGKRVRRVHRLVRSSSSEFASWNQRMRPYLIMYEREAIDIWGD